MWSFVTFIVLEKLHSISKGGKKKLPQKLNLRIGN
jgi:hypothetical protein